MHGFTKRVRGIPIVAACAAILAGCASASIRSNPLSSFGQSQEPSRDASPAPDLEDLRDQVVEAHNRIRADGKLNKLSVSKKLQSAAQAHALDMAEHRKMSQEGFRRHQRRRIKTKASRGTSISMPGENRSAVAKAAAVWRRPLTKLAGHGLTMGKTSSANSSQICVGC